MRWMSSVAGGEAVLAVVGDGERSGPGVEDLDDVGAGFDLLGGVVDEDGHEFFHQEGPCGPGAYMSFLASM